jgi:threonylcarbamoyladenosine tRNA methylthiotransferase MtaB
MKIHLSSLGCKLNQSEMDDLALRLVEAGHVLVAAPGDADVCILNTCAVTHVAAQKSRQALGRLHREGPGARLIVTGCYAELAAAELARLPGVEWVAGNRDKDRLADRIGPPSFPPSLRSGQYSSPTAAGEGSEPALWHEMKTATGSVGPAAAGGRSGGRTRALVKIQDGCDNACTYCIVRVARGPQRSRPAADVLADVRARVEAGYREIVLTGVHIGAYGRDLAPVARPGREHEATGGLWALAGRLLAETGVERLRLSSIEPWDLPEEALRLWADPRLCRHLHLPLQSGSDAVLRRMARRYTAAEFAALVAAARAAIPGLAVTTDVIVGFPGETEAEFAESLAFVRAMAPARVHVFPFSAREGTPAAQMPGAVPPAVKAARARAMRAAGAEGELAFRRSLLGQTLPVLWETARPGDGALVWTGLTDNYVRVEAAWPGSLANTITPTRLVAPAGGGLEGIVEQ